MAFPLTYHRITNSYFRTCSTRRSRSQVGLCVCTLCTISVRAEPTFERLRYAFGGDRPSQTAHLTVSPDQIHGRRLENQQYKGGIPRLPPSKLTPGFRWLPPILYMHYRSSWTNHHPYTGASDYLTCKFYCYHITYAYCQSHYNRCR